MDYNFFKTKIKSLNRILLVLFSVFVLFGCTDNEGDEGEGGNMEYIAGEFSGVLVGSTGSYTLKLEEDNVIAVVFFNGNIYTLTSNESLAPNGSITLTEGTISIKITDTGDLFPKLTFTIPGHSVQYTIVTNVISNPNRNYVGTSINTSEGRIIRKSTFNLTIYGSNWKGIEKVILNTEDPEEVNEIIRAEGKITEDADSVSFFWNNDELIFTLNKIGDRLVYTEEIIEQVGGVPEVVATFEIELTKK